MSTEAAGVAETGMAPDAPRAQPTPRALTKRGERMQRAVGELLTCTRCAGTWSALVLVGLRTASPVAGRATTNVLALAGANDLMQSGFRLLVEGANQAAPTELAHRNRPGERVG